MRQSRACNVPMTVGEVVVDETASLHKGIGRGRAAKTEAARLEILGDGPAQRRLGRDLGHAGETVLNGLAVHEAPEKGGQRLAFRQIEVSARIGDGCFDLAAMPDNARVGKQLRDFPFVVTRDLLRLEPVEGLAEILAFPKDREPGQAGLETLQDQLLEELGVSRFRNAPLLVMVVDVKRVAARPRAAVEAIATA